MKHIVQVDTAQQTGAMDSQREWNMAQAREGKAKADHDEMTTRLAAARNDRARAKLDVDTALSNKKLAEASSDTNKINVAQKDLRTAELSVKAADARLRYYEAYRNWLKISWRNEQEHMYWREAQFELQKAQLAQKNNIAPKGVTFANFPKQEADRGKRAQSSKQKSESGKGKAMSAREEWLKAQQTADQASGKPSGFPDPMAGAATAGS
ncbi:MAG: hypothetical protein H0V17_00035 [Deltaproteobacteria bacterium]|nr:hypothetical protein [Deltaproteobacteria bacterium]